jgi:acetyl esterase/lipase
MKPYLLPLVLLALVVTIAQAENVPPLPKVLIIGDSISIGYTPPLTEMLRGKAEVVHNPGNAAHSAYGLENLDAWLGDTQWDVIHFNHGLHDLKYVDDSGKNVSNKELGHQQIPVEQYAKNMEAIVSRLKETGAKLIFATTTPFPVNLKNPVREKADVAAYNDAALEVMKKYDVAVNDLCAFAEPRLAELQLPMNVHFTEIGSEALARETAKPILRALGLPEQIPIVQTLWPDKVRKTFPKLQETTQPDKGDGVIRVTDVNNPTLTLYLPENATTPLPVVLVFPGGGYNILAINKEGTEIAAWLNSIGVAAAVVKYRVPENRDGAFQDAQRAVRLVRQHAAKWNLDPARVGVMGFSAGGHLSACASTGFEETTYAEVDDADKQSCRPDFCILIYPAYLDNEKQDGVAPELHIAKDIPPTFIVHTLDDKRFITGSKLYARALKDAGVPCDYQVFETGGHGYGLRSEGHPVSVWPQRCEEWLKTQEIVK